MSTVLSHLRQKSGWSLVKKYSAAVITHGTSITRGLQMHPFMSILCGTFAQDKQSLYAYSCGENTEYPQ